MVVSRPSSRSSRLKKVSSHASESVIVRTRQPAIRGTQKEASHLIFRPRFFPMGRPVSVSVPSVLVLLPREYSSTPPSQEVRAEEDPPPSPPEREPRPSGGFSRARPAASHPGRTGRRGGSKSGPGRGAMGEWAGEASGVDRIGGDDDGDGDEDGGGRTGDDDDDDVIFPSYLLRLFYVDLAAT